MKSNIIILALMFLPVICISGTKKQTGMHLAQLDGTEDQLIVLADSLITRHSYEELLNFSQKLEPGSLFWDILLSKSGQKLQERILSGRLSKNDPEIRKIVQRFSHNGFFIKIPKSDWEKLIDHIKEGNYGYIGKRLHNKMLENKSIIQALLLSIEFFLLLIAGFHIVLKNLQCILRKALIVIMLIFSSLIMHGGDYDEPNKSEATNVEDGNHHNSIENSIEQKLQTSANKNDR